MLPLCLIKGVFSSLAIMIQCKWSYCIWSRRSWYKTWWIFQVLHILLLRELSRPLSLLSFVDPELVINQWPVLWCKYGFHFILLYSVLFESRQIWGYRHRINTMLLIVFYLFLLCCQACDRTKFVLLEFWEIQELVVEILELLEVILETIIIEIHHLVVLRCLVRNILIVIFVHEFLKIWEILTTDATTSESIHKGLWGRLVWALVHGWFKIWVNLL